MTNGDPNNHWISSPFAHPASWPQWRYHATEAPRHVNSPAELEKLGEGWSSTYIHKDYPKTKFRLKAEPKPGEPLYETRVVDTPEEESKLESGWSDTLPKPPEEQPHAQASTATRRIGEQTAKEDDDERRKRQK
jgi:hypothetical protein